MSAIKLEVKCGKVSVVKKTINLGIVVPRDQIKLAEADKLFSDSRVRVSIKPIADGDDTQQTFLPGHEPKPMVAVVDIKGYRGESDAFKPGLTFNRKEMDDGEVASYSSARAVLVIEEHLGRASTLAAQDEDDGE